MSNILTALRTVAVCLAAGLMLAACGEAKLEEIVKSASENCPMKFGNVGSVTAVEANDTAVVFTIALNDSIVAADSLAAEQEKAEDLIRALLEVPDGDTKELLAVMVGQKKGLAYVFTSGKGSARAVITGKRLAQLVDPNGKPIPNPQRQIRKAATDSIQKMMATASQLLPMNVGNGIVVERIELEGGYLVYHCLLDGKGISIDKVEANAATVKKSMLKVLPKLQDFSAVCKEGEIGLIYRYHTPKPEEGSKAKQKTFGIVITPAEMAD